MKANAYNIHKNTTFRNETEITNFIWLELVIMLGLYNAGTNSEMIDTEEVVKVYRTNPDFTGTCCDCHSSYQCVIGI